MMAMLNLIDPVWYAFVLTLSLLVCFFRYQARKKDEQTIREAKDTIREAKDTIREEKDTIRELIMSLKDILNSKK